MAFDGAANLLVTVPSSSALYRIPPGGGAATDARKVREGYGQAAGLAFDRNGRLYMARRDKGDVIEINPADGHYVRTVASGMPCPVGLATDPVSGDLFASNNNCPGGGIMRISGYESAQGKVSAYAGSQDADGITFAPDGTLYAAAGTKVVRIDGTSSSRPGSVSDVAYVPTIDGIAFAPASLQGGAYLVVNRNDGEIDRLDFDGRLTPVVTGATRGDLATVGPDRCIYATLEDRVIKVGPAMGECGFAPPAGAVLGTRRASRRIADTDVVAAAPKRAKRGARFILKVRVVNRGPATAQRVVVSDRLPRGLSILRVTRSARGARCQSRRGVLTCRLGTLAKGRSFTIAIAVRAVTAGVYVNRASVKSADLDPSPGNNRARSRTRV
jgi:uncharacterized repeat protein (TIGR01451 family)